MATIKTPPIKIQGIKTKLIPFISSHLPTRNYNRWIEPFMGSGVVGFNFAGKRAIFADVNPYTIDFYKNIKNGVISARRIKEYLIEQAPLLKEGGSDYYRFVRDRFNKEHNPLDLLFLNRSCFNGLMRFNKNGKYNVPFGHKPERFAQAYITKIYNQSLFVENKIRTNDWDFVCCSFDKIIGIANGDDFIYCDPPYIGRHVDYFDSWDEAKEKMLHIELSNSGCLYMVSTWHHNHYRKNTFIDSLWSNCNIFTRDHFYHVGAKETNRQPIVEALMTNYKPNSIHTSVEPRLNQMILDI